MTGSGRWRAQQLQGAGDLAQGAGGDLAVQRGGIEAPVAEQDLDDADVDLLLQQMGGKGMPTGILTLLMIRGLCKFTTDTIRTMASRSTLFAVYDVKAMKRSS